MTITKNTSTHNTQALANRSIEYIVIHYTAGATSKAGSAVNTANYYKTTDREVSSDYTVDDAGAVLYNPDIRTGAIYGLMGALILALIFHHDRQESPDLRQIIFMIFWIVYGSFAIPNVDFAAHIGGLISGFAMYTLLTLSKEKGI